MKRLERLKLYGEGLVPVATPALVARYNETLEELGLEATRLERFHIDGLGWSPEIAEERGRRYYLSHGMANPLAVIVTPDQRHKPVYTPFTSYDRRLMATYFERFLPEIADVTRDTAIWLDFDRQLSRFNSPCDLLLVPYVKVRSHAGRLTEAGVEQQTLAERFQGEESAWFDPELRQRILDSAQRHGDLRFRRLVIPDLRYDEVQSFYTGLFNGLFVIRDLPHRDHLLILQDDETGKAHEDCSRDIWSLSHRTLPLCLFDEKVIDLDMTWYRQHPDALREKLEYLALDAICDADPEVDFAGLTLPQRQQRLTALAGGVPDVYFELERLIVQLDSTSPDPHDLSSELRSILWHPHGRFAAGTIENDLIWQLLCRLSPLDVMRLYIVDKESFFAAYRSWPESKKRWTAQRIADRYRPRMDR